MGKGQSNQKSLLGLCTALVLISGSAFVWKFGPGQTKSRDLTSYTVFAESGTLPGLISASGELQAVRSVNVSPERQGLLEELYVTEGEVINKDQLIAKMDAGDYLYRLNEFKAEYEKQKAAFERREALFVAGAISSEQHDEYLNHFLKSKARLQQSEVEGEEFIIRAPFSGIVTTRYAEPGAFVAPTTRASSVAGSTSSSIIELSQGLEVTAKVPESDIGRILVGQNAAIRVDAFPDKRFEAKVSEIAPRASKTDNVTSFDVTLVLINSPKSLRIGMTADIDFKTGESDLNTLVPTVAIVTKSGKPGVLIVDQNDEPLFQKVELGTSSGSKTAILEGVQPGNRIFIDMPPWVKQKSD